MKPTLTPIEAERRLKVDGSFRHDGWTYYLDGPPMCDVVNMSPVATNGEFSYFVDGEIDSPITDASQWVIEC